MGQDVSPDDLSEENRDIQKATRTIQRLSKADLMKGTQSTGDLIKASQSLINDRGGSSFLSSGKAFLNNPIVQMGISTAVPLYGQAQTLRYLNSLRKEKAMGGMMYNKGSLVGNQSLLDKNDDGKISGSDFDKLRKDREPKRLGSLLVKGGEKLLSKVLPSPEEKFQKKLKNINDIFEDAPQNIKNRIANKEKNVLKKKGETEENLLSAKVNLIDKDPTIKSYERYLDLQLDRSITRKLKQNDIEIQENYKKLMEKINDDNEKISITGEELTKARDERMAKQEGGAMGDMAMPSEMMGMEDDMPVDTYPNIPPEEMAAAEASQLPDADMEEEYLSFVFDQSLDDQEQDYLSKALEADPKLSQILDKVVMTASEFSGAGKVEGPGSGVSDSIPARLSDGEFVFTKKATDQMGAGNLQTMMDDAERAYDGGMMRSPKQEGGMMYKQKDEDPLAYEKIAQDEIKKNMLRANRAPSLLGGN